MIICGYCYHDNNDEGHAQHCPFKRGSAWDIGGLFAPNSTPLSIREDEWVRTPIGRYRIKEPKEYEKNTTN